MLLVLIYNCNYVKTTQYKEAKILHIWGSSSTVYGEHELRKANSNEQR